MSAAERYADLSDLVEGALRDQQDLSAVERFAQRHDADLHALDAERYEDLIPLGRTPGFGEQLSFRVDLDRCTGCKSCVSACHSLNGLGEDETWRSVGLVVGIEASEVDTPTLTPTATATPTLTTIPTQQTVTTACHHCADPACLAGCPVQAYEKDPVTGIVRHLDDQCIGCQYCILKCPYDVPKYDATRGIVRKCDMCADRLAEGEAPACVQACPTSAISIAIVDVAGPAANSDMLPVLASSLPSASYTRPTTRYVSDRALGMLRPASDAELRPSGAHDPLAVMLVLTQLSVGTLVLEALFGSALLDSAKLTRLALIGISAALGLGAATLHLGRPLLAFRALLGLRTSWMSREILGFGIYVPAALATAGLASLAYLGGPYSALASRLLPALEGLTLAAGLGALYCSIMIYVDTQRASWSFARTAKSFCATALLLGALAAAATGLGGPWFALLGAGSLALVMRSEQLFMLRAPEEGKTNLDRSARLLATLLRPRFRWRLVTGCVAVGVAILAAPLMLGDGPLVTVVASLALLLAVASELIGRHLYFTAEASRAMPGV